MSDVVKPESVSLNPKSDYRQFDLEPLNLNPRRILHDTDDTDNQDVFDRSRHCGY